MDPQGIGVPDSLYNLGISAVIDNYQCFKNEIRILPDNLMFDLYYKVRILVLVIEAGNQNIVKKNLTYRWKLEVIFHIHARS
jgi:hypothetical protein